MKIISFLLFSPHALFAQNLLINGSFEEPVFSDPSINGSPTVPGWTGIPFIFTGDNGAPWPGTAYQGSQFADAGNGSSFLVSQTFSAPSGLGSITWSATTSGSLASGIYRVELKSSPGATLIVSENFNVLGGIHKDTWETESLPLGASFLPPGNYTLTFQSVSTSGQDFFIDQVIALSPNTSTISSAGKFAWSANSGWLNFRPSVAAGVVVTETYLAQCAYATNFGWIKFGNGFPANGVSYSNATGSDSGVNISPSGDLSGLAWSVNVGWLNFGAATGSHRARLDLLTGQFHGYVYGANFGWIRLNEFLTTDFIHCPDSDGDGLADSWERQYFGNLSQSAADDPDGDGFDNREEYQALTLPLDSSSRMGRTLLNILESDTLGVPDFWVVSTVAHPGRVYQFQRSDDLKNWFSMGSPRVPSSSVPISIIGDPVTNPKNQEFFRVKISKPLSGSP